jgi:hypothetical protein
MNSIIVSFVGDYEFVFCRRFNYVTLIYISNRWVFLEFYPFYFALLSKWTSRVKWLNLLRISATLCVISHVVLFVATPKGCNTLNRILITTESASQFTSSALLLIR